MFIKKLSLNGFKSFCDYSEIIFDKGISAIVGPNGCGKSNIVDAIKWVVGEQKTKMLRANNMTDVIFKGTEERKGLSRAEVKLTIINEQNILPIEFNEIEISRVIYASGESEYYINKQKVRLKDIQELFFDTGVGKSAYSIMEQGKIDLILSNKPEDRRYIIEEAAGITKYRVKREEAAAKLAQANENIIRVNDIVKEVKSQLEHMSIQAEKARKYKLILEKELNLEIEINLNRIAKQKIERDRLKDELEIANKELEEINSQINLLEEELDERMVFLNELENKKIDYQRELMKLESELKIFNSNEIFYKDQLLLLISTQNSEKEKIKNLEQKIIDIENELESIENSKFDLDEKILSLIKDESNYNNSITELNNNILNNEQEIVKIKKLLLELNNQLEIERINHKKITDELIEKIEESLNIIDINSNEIISIKNNLNNNINNIILELPIARSFIDDIIKLEFLSNQNEKLINLLIELKNKLLNTEEKIKNINIDIEKYIKVTEMFISDLFSPEGVIQKKKKNEHKISELINDIKNNENYIERLQIKIVEDKEKREKFKEILSNIKINLSSMYEKKNSFDKEISRIISLKNTYENNKQEINNKIKFNEEKINELRKNLSEIEKNSLSLKDKKNLIDKELKELEKNIIYENQKLSNEKKYIQEINSRWQNKKNMIEKLNFKINEATTTINNIYESCYEDLSINLTEYESKGGYITNRSYEEIRKELQDIRNQKHQLGNVNLLAIEECKALEERFNLLNSQLEDLEKSKKDIEYMMNEINKKSEELFLSTFNQIKSNFHKLFRKLFDGGNAEISLTNPENLLETGIEITARPPGQKTQNITLLSGGQRTMTAISLMFSTFLVKPSPFCILDEIDAALDEENVSRFIQLLKEFKETSQFVIITHNKKTIASADILYGVTQEEKGVSKIVSAKFAEKII